MNELIVDPMVLSISIPLVGGLFCLLMPAPMRSAGPWLAIGGAAATLLAVWPLFSGGERFLEFGAISLRVNPLSGLMLLAAAFFALVVAVYSLEYMRGKPGRRAYDACLLWSLAFSCGVFLANDLVMLLICWGLLALTLYVMIGLAGVDAAEASRKTFIIVGGSDSLLLLGVALLWVQNGSTRMDVGALNLDTTTGTIAVLCFTAAALAKIGAVPLHSWIPDSGEKAYPPVTAFLPASLDKLLGIYLLARVSTDLFTVTEWYSVSLMLIGIVTIIAGAMMALVQRNLKRLLAYCAVSQVGYMLLGIGTGTELGLAAALFHMLNHAIGKSCLFLGAGVVERNLGTVDLDQLGGLATRLPVTFAACLVAALSVSGIPPLNGFVSKWLIYQSVIESGQSGGTMLWVVCLAAAMLGTALTLAVIVKMLHAVFLCKPSPHVRETNQERPSLIFVLPMVVLAFLCVVLGVFANTLALPRLILPAIDHPDTIPGTAWVGYISGLMLLAFTLGWIVYGLTMRRGRLRHCPTFVGGERLDEAYIPGVPTGARRHVEVTGVDFYKTVEQLPVLKPLFQLARRQIFDIYHNIGMTMRWIVSRLRRWHSGLLPRYLAWFVLGLIAILYVAYQGGF